MQVSRGQSVQGQLELGQLELGRSELGRSEREQALPEREATAVAYEEAALGDGALALRLAVGDMLELEAVLAATARAVSYGYVRGALRSPEPAAAPAAVPRQYP